MSKPNATKKRLSAEDRRESILQAARELFRSNGLRGTSTRQIAAAARVNEALIYRHFENKDALFFEAIVEPIEALRGQVDQIMAAVPPDSGRELDWDLTKLVYEQTLAVMEDVLPSLALVLFDPEHSERFYRDHFEPTLDHIERTVVEFLTRWPHHRFDTRVATRAFVGACLMLAIDSRLTGRPISREHAARELAGIFRRGVVDSERPPAID